MNMRLIFFLIFIVLFFNTTMVSASTIINITASGDSYIADGQPDTNFGSETTLFTYWYVYHRSIFIKFNISQIPSNAIINSADIYLYLYQCDVGCADQNVDANVVTSSWDENTITWNNQPSIISTPESTINVNPEGLWYKWNVKNGVNNWVNNSIINNGIRIYDTSYQSIRYRYYYSREAGGSNPYISINYTVIPPTPVINSTMTGNFYINTTWTAGTGVITDSYNSTNGTTWVNDTNAYRNTTLSAHAWQNLTIYAYNATDGTLNSTPLINNTQIPNNAPVQSSIGAKSVNEGSWLNFSISSTDSDGDSLTYGTNASKGTLTTNSYSWQPTYSDSGIYTWYFNSTDNYSAVATETIVVTVNNMDFIPPVPTMNSTIIYNIGWDSWVNSTWNVGVGNVTDSYNVSVNGVWWNTTNTYDNQTLMSPHAWHNVTVYAWNSSGTGTLSSTALSNNTQLPNNAISISNVSSAYTLSEGELLSIYPTSSDADSDTPTFSTTATKGTFYTNNGTLLWTPASGENGTYNWQITADDGYGSTNSIQFSVSVNSTTPGMPGNLAVGTGNFWINYTWTAGVNTDTFNVSQNGIWTNGSAFTFMNTTLKAHNWSNITVYGYNNTLKGLGNASSLNTQVPNNAPTLGSSSISATSIYPVSQSLTITVDNVNDTDNDNITGVTVGITYLGFETNYSMTNTANTTTWTKDFSTGVSGFYTVTAFYATDNYSATTKKTVSHQFEVVTVTTGGSSSGGGGGGGGVVVSTPTPTPTPTSTTNITVSSQPIINLKTLPTDPYGNIILQFIFFGGIFGIVLGITTTKKRNKSILLLGIALVSLSSYGMGWLV